MDICYRAVEKTREVYDYMNTLRFPYRYGADFADWERSYDRDVDGEGRRLFSRLETIGAYRTGRLAGFVQYGHSAFGFDESGAVTSGVSYPIIRQLYFASGDEEIGCCLLDRARAALACENGRVYAFFHYFGLSCYARHGKLFEGCDHVHRLLLEAGFQIEHENVYYSSLLTGVEPADAALCWHETTAGRQASCDFLLRGRPVGGCEVHFLEQAEIAYLRWIYVDENLRGQGIGSMCMAALKSDLFRRGIRRFDTDTALANTTAQRYYERNRFTREGLTRSYYTREGC